MAVVRRRQKPGSPTAQGGRAAYARLSTFARVSRLVSSSLDMEEALPAIARAAWARQIKTEPDAPRIVVMTLYDTPSIARRRPGWPTASSPRSTSPPG
jgi:hypothetical protein